MRVAALTPVAVGLLTAPGVLPIPFWHLTIAGLIVAPLLSFAADMTFWTRRLGAWRRAAGGLDRPDLEIEVSSDSRTISVRSASAPAALQVTNEAPGDDSLRTGDPGFALRVTGPEIEARCILDRRTRDALVRLAGERDGYVQDGAVVLPLAFAGNHWWFAVPRLLAELVDLADSLRPDNPLPRLRDIAMDLEEPPETRGRALAALRTAWPDAEETDWATRALTSSRNPEIWLHAAIGLGPDGPPLLERLLASPKAEPALKARAVGPLGRALDHRAAVLRLATLLEDRSAPIRAAALRALAERKVAPPPDVIERALGAGTSDLLLAAAALIGATAPSGATAFLFRLMDRYGDEDWARPHAIIGCLDALGAIGGAEAVEPLMALADSRVERHGAGAIRMAADRALAAIQARLGTEGAGGLSLVAPTAAEGAVSLVEEAGRLEVVES